jgi:uncharacterized protein (TIGR00251 family)
MKRYFNKGDIINLQIICNANKQEIIRIDSNTYKLKINSQPIKNKANKEIIKYFKNKNYKIKILKGLKSNKKVIKIIDDPKQQE